MSKKRNITESAAVNGEERNRQRDIKNINQQTENALSRESDIFRLFCLEGRTEEVILP